MALGARSAVLRAAKGTTWSQFVDYASPALFDVMPLRTLFSQGREFIKNGRDQERFEKARQQIGDALDERKVAIRIAADEPKTSASLTDLATETKRDIGQRVLQLYFTQLLATPTAILDLRSESFHASEEGLLTWTPRALYVEWDPDYLAGLRQVYVGFYLDDDAEFERGVEGIGLEGSGDLLRKHLGSGDQRNVRFETSAFHSSFHDLFVRCRDRGVTLHRNFLALGVYLVCLYDVLESLGLEFDARGAFEHSHDRTNDSTPTPG